MRQKLPGSADEHSQEALMQTEILGQTRYRIRDWTEVGKDTVSYSYLPETCHQKAALTIELAK